MTVSVQEVDFDVGAEIAALSIGLPSVGAVASFVGLVRGAEGRDPANELEPSTARSSISAMTLEHYPGMTEQALTSIVAEARARWVLGRVRVIHRFGRLRVGERIVFVGVACPHRADAFAACEFIMDYLKTQAPFWKKEESDQGSHWVDAREADDLAKERWR
jgi:molybdopterin synthase catalytic subunit